MYSQAEYSVFSPRIHYNQQVDTTKNNITMKLTFVLRNKQNALKLSTKTLDSFIERIKTDTKDGVVARRRHEFNHCGSTDSYDQQHPSHQIYPSVEFERDVNDNLRMRTFNGVVALTIDNLQSAEEIEAVKQTAKILHYTLAAFVGATGKEVIILVRIAKADGSMPMDEEEADFHGIAEEVLDEAAQEDGRGGFVVEDGQPERVESQVDEDHDEEEGNAGAQQCDVPAVEEPTVDVACEEAGDEEAREEDARAEQGRADEVGGRGNEATLHGAVHCTVDGDRQEAEGDAHEDRLDGKDVGEEYRQGHGDTGVDEWLDRESGHEKRPSFPL